MDDPPEHSQRTSGHGWPKFALLTNPVDALDKRTFCDVEATSALPPKADMCSATRDVRFVPIADIDRQRSYLTWNKLGDCGVVGISDFWSAPRSGISAGIVAPKV